MLLEDTNRVLQRDDGGDTGAWQSTMRLYEPYTIVAWMSCSDLTLGEVSFLTA